MKLWTRVVSCRNAVWEMAPDVDGMVRLLGVPPRRPGRTHSSKLGSSNPDQIVEIVEIRHFRAIECSRDRPQIRASE